MDGGGREGGGEGRGGGEEGEGLEGAEGEQGEGRGGQGRPEELLNCYDTTMLPLHTCTERHLDSITTHYKPNST